MSSEKKELIGPAEEKIRTLLSQSGDPLEAIRAIQKDYGLDLAGIDNMYPLLDLCGYSRLEIHGACLDALNKATVHHIEQPTFQLENFYDLFEKTFKYIHIPLMQPIPMALLKKFERNIGEDIIEKLKSDLAVFENCPLNIKQRIWKQDESFFQQTMISLLNDYHHDEALQLLSLNLRPDNYQEMIEERRTHPIVLKVMDTISQDPEIYRMFIQMIRIVFEATPYPSLCSLRVDVLMNFHDLDCEPILRIDRCHQLIWSLDSCVRNQNMDETIIEKIKECFDNVKNGSTLYADFAMVLMDPMISNFLASTIVKWLRHNVEDSTQQEDLEDLTNYNGKLLNLAEHAPYAIAHNTKIPKLDKDLKESYWSAICSLMLEEGNDVTVPMGDKPASIILPLLRRSDIARKVFVHYLVDRTFEGDIKTLTRCLPLILETWPAPEFEEEGIIYRQTYLSFIKTMMDILVKRNLFECIADVKWRQAVVEGFLLKVVAWDCRIHEQMIRFLAEYFLDPKILVKLGPQVGILVEWAEVTVVNGLKDDKHMKTLKELYAFLLSRSNSILNAHVDHGKTTLSDSLLATNGIISSKMAGKVRYLDSREDEQERGITMESSAISLYFKLVKSVSNEEAQPKMVESEYLINLIDSPGHVDFSSEVSTASRLCDGGLVLIDVVEGVCTQTVSVLRQAWIDKVRPVLVFNKMDRLIVELQMTPHEAYIHINKILEQVNAVMATFFTGDLMESEARKMTDEKKDEEEEFDANKVYDWSVEDRDDSDIYFDPARGNVIFSSAVDGWAFRVQQFASLYAKKLGFKESVLQKCLWGEYYFDHKAKRVILPKHLKGRNLKPMFVQFVLENIWAVYGSVIIEPDRERVEKIVGALKIKVLPRDLRSRDPQILLSAIFSQWLPLSTCVLLAIIGQLPPPKDAQRMRLPKMLYPNIHRKDNDPLEPTNDVEKALYNCDISPEAPVVAYVSKMFAVPVEFLPENRRTQMTAEEMRERGRQQRELRAAQAALDKSGEGIPLNTEQINILTQEAEAEEEQAVEELKGESLIGFARLYSGTIRVGQKLYVLGPKYDPKYPKKHISEITVQSLYLIMGRDVESLDEVCAGNVFGIGGLEGHILKNGTLASTLENVRNMAGVKMETSPIVRVALEPEDPTQMDKLVEGLHLLNQADPCVEVMLQETGEHVILTAGELHLERCLRDLKERFAKIEIHASEPIVPFRESIVRAELSTNKDKDGVMIPRGQAEIKINSKFLTLKVQTVPLPTRITEFLTKHAASIKAVVEEKLAKKSSKEEDVETGDAAPLATNQLLSASELEQLLKEEFAQVKKEGGPFASLWDDVVDQIWAFGPRRIGSNLLINRIPGYVRKPFFQVDSKKSADVAGDHADEVLKVEDEDTSALSILDIDFHIHTGFQLTTLTGPLCAEPMTGVCYIVQGVEFHPEEMVSSSGEAVDVRSRLPVIQGHVIAAAKEAYRQGFLDWSPRLLLAMYTCDIQANAEVLGRVYGVISKRKGKIVSEDLKDGTSFWQINALLPVIESFGFSDEIRKRTSGAASPQLVFSGFEMLDEDPFWVPTTEEELEDLGEKADKENLARKYMDTVRKRKGMFVEKKLVEHAEKQRTLKKN